MEELDSTIKERTKAAIKPALLSKCPFNIPTCTGCVGPQRTPPDEGLRLQHELLFWNTMSNIAGLRSPNLKWHQLKQSFVASYWSTGVMSSSKAFLHVFQWLAPQSPAMNAARDALCLIHLGARYRDQRLLLEGRTRHLAALQCMQEEVAKPNAASDDCILGAAYTLGHCEMYKMISQNGIGWRGHVGGFQMILEIRGPTSIRSPFAHALLHNIRQVSVMDSFLKRKGSFLASAKWLACADQSASPEDRSPAIRAVDMALQIGVLVEQADQLCLCTDPQEESIVPLLDAMVRMEDNLQMWLVELYMSGDGSTPYWLTPTTKYSSFNERCGALALVFPWAMQFTSLLGATSHAYIWICLLLLRESVLSVARLSPYPLLRPVDQDAVLLAAVDECAQNLAQSVAYLSSGDFGFAGILACGGPLHFASQWFQQRRDSKKVMWCKHVRDFLQRDILLGGSFNTSLDLQRPVFTWWMLPDIFNGSVPPVATKPNPGQGLPDRIRILKDTGLSKDNSHVH